MTDDLTQPNSQIERPVHLQPPRRRASAPAPVQHRVNLDA